MDRILSAALSAAHQQPDTGFGAVWKRPDAVLRRKPKKSTSRHLPDDLDSHAKGTGPQTCMPCKRLGLGKKHFVRPSTLRSMSLHVDACQVRRVNLDLIESPGSSPELKWGKYR